ncbi:MAG: hypothetical protein ABIN48_06275, partial [Ginsengibacter sp.]
ENPCEHWNWQGQNLLINDRNEVLLDSFELSQFANINFYSLHINQKNTNPDFIEFKSKDGTIYSFMDFKKEFTRWFNNDFLKNISSANLANYFFEEITISKESPLNTSQMDNPKYADYAWVVDKGTDVLKNNKEKIETILSKVNQKNLIISISAGQNPILLDYEKYKEYFSDCGDFLHNKHPYFEVSITDNNGLVLNGLGFIRTSNGYKLLEIY